MSAKKYLFILPRKHLCHTEFAHVVISVIPNQKDRKISMLMKFTEKIFFRYIEINYKSFSQYANDEIQIVVTFVTLHTEMSFKFFDLSTRTLGNMII